MRLLIAFILLLICATIAQGQTTQINPIRRYDFDNLSQDEFGSGFKFDQYFDGGIHNPRGLGNPNIDTFGRATTPNTTRSSHYPMGLETNGQRLRSDGYRMLLDFVGDANIFNLTNKVHFDGFYGLQIGGNNTDSILLINYDTLMVANYNRRDDLLAFPDSLMQGKVFARLSMGNPAGDPVNYEDRWNNAGTFSQDCRYVMMLIKRADHLDGGGNHQFYSIPLFSELVFYGSRSYNPMLINLKSFAYTGAKPARVPYGQMSGVNDVGVFVSVLKPDHLIREYESLANYDSDTTAWPNNVINGNPYNTPQSFFISNIRDPQINDGKIIMESVRGGSGRMALHGSGSFPGQGMPVTEYGMFGEIMESYDRDAYFYKWYAAKWGHSTHPWTSDSFRVSNEGLDPGYNLGYHGYIESGNEGEFRGETILGKVCRQIREYDAMLQGDSSFRFIDGAFVGLDTSRAITQIFLWKVLRPDHKVGYYAFNGHHYMSSNAFFYQDPTIEQLVGVHGERPEWDRLPKRLADWQDVIYRELDGDTTKKIWWTEFGYDNYATPSTTLDQTNYPWTIYGVPKISGADSLETKSALIARIVSIANYYLPGGKLCEFMITNNFFNQVNDPTQFASSGRAAVSGTVDNRLLDVKFKNYWANYSFWDGMKNYVADSAVIDSLGRNTMWWHNVNAPDSVCIEVWKGTVNGSSLSSQTITFGDSLAGNISKRQLSFTGTSMSKSTVTPSAGGTTSQTITETPVFYFGLVNGSGGAPPPADPIDAIVVPKVGKKYFKVQ